MSDVLDGKDEFIIYTPNVVDIIAKGASEADLDRTRPIGGTCSTERLDRQDEVVFAKGLDFTEFVQHGYYNDNHKQETAAILGAPRFAELRKGAWHTEGNLLVGYEPADRIWQLAKALAKSNVGRRLGFSIEGKVTERGMDNKILKAKIRHVAITNSPVNTDCTWTILAKAFAPVGDVDAGNIRRALSAGYAAPGASGGAALNGRVDREPELKLLTFDEAVERVSKSRPHLPRTACERIVRIIYKLEEQRR